MALLDACVLVPITLADTLLCVAERELYRPLWSERILAEAADDVLEIHADLAPVVVAKRFATMNDTFEDALVEGWEIFEATLTLCVPLVDQCHGSEGRLKTTKSGRPPCPLDLGCPGHWCG